MKDMEPHEIAHIDQMSTLIGDISGHIFEAILLRAEALWQYDEFHEMEMNESLSHILRELAAKPDVMGLVMMAAFRGLMASMCVSMNMSPLELHHEITEHNTELLIELNEKFNEMRFIERKPRCGSNAHITTGLGWPGV